MKKNNIQEYPIILAKKVAANCNLTPPSLVYNNRDENRRIYKTDIAFEG